MENSSPEQNVNEDHFDEEPDDAQFVVDDQQQRREKSRVVDDNEERRNETVKLFPPTQHEHQRRREDAVDLRRQQLPPAETVDAEPVERDEDGGKKNTGDHRRVQYQEPEFEVLLAGVEAKPTLKKGFQRIRQSDGR